MKLWRGPVGADKVLNVYIAHGLDLVGMDMKSVCTQSSDQEKHSTDFTCSFFIDVCRFQRQKSCTVLSFRPRELEQTPLVYQ